MLIPLIYPTLAGLLAFFVAKTQHFHPDSLIDRFLEYRLSKQLQTYERRLDGEVAKAIVELVTSKIEARSIVLALPASPSVPVIPQESQAITEPEGPPGTKYYLRHYVTALKHTLRRSPNLPLWDCILGMLELVDVIDSFICFCLVLASGLSLRWLFCPALPADGSSTASINRAPSPGPHARRTSTSSDTHKETLLILRPTHKQSGSPNIGVAAVDAQVPLPFATSYQIVVSPSIPSALTSELLRSDPAVLPSLSVVSESALPNQPPSHLVIGNIEIASSRLSVRNSCIRYNPNNATQTPAAPAQEPASLGGTRPLSVCGTFNRWNVAAHTVRDLSDKHTSLAGQDLDPSKTESMILNLNSTSFVSDGPSADEVVTPRPSSVNGKSDNIPQENYSSASQDLDLISCHSKTKTSWVEMLSLDSTSFVLSEYVPSSASSDLISHSSSATSEFDQFSGGSGSPVRQDLYFFNSDGKMNTETLSLDSTPFTPDSCSATHDLSHSPNALEVFGSPSVGQDLEPVNHHLSINPPADHACAPVHDIMPHSSSVVGDPFTSSDSGTLVSSDLEMITPSSSASLDNTRPVDQDEPGQPPATEIEDVSSSTTPGSSADSNAQADHMDLGLNVQTPASKIEGVSSSIISNSSAGSDTQAINQADSSLKVQTPATKMEDSITPVPLWRGRTSRQEAMTARQSRAVNRSSSSNVNRARGNTYAPYLDRRVQVERPWRRSAGSLLCSTPESSRG